MVPANKSSHECIRDFSAAVGASGYKEAIEWRVIHPSGPHTDVITLYKEIVGMDSPLTCKRYQPAFASFHSHVPYLRSRSVGHECGSNRMEAVVYALQL